jgi:hypothetical protein
LGLLYFGFSAPFYSWVAKWLRGMKRSEDVFELYEGSCIDWPESTRLPQFDPGRDHPPNYQNHQDTAVNCIRSFEGIGLDNAALTAGYPLPNNGHDRTAGRVISRISRYTQVGKISRPDSFSDR